MVQIFKMCAVVQLGQSVFMKEFGVLELPLRRLIVSIYVTGIDA